MKRPDDRPAEEKLRIVLAAQGLSDEELGVFLREEGIHEAQLEQWREQALGGLRGTPQKSSSRPSRRIRQLERELARKEKALAEAAALYVLQEKAQAIWGDEDDDTE